MIKKIPMRMCIVSKEKYPKSELIRIVKFNEKVFIDETGKSNGKGCYLKKDRDIVLKAKKCKILNRIFEREIDDKIYDDILELI